MERIILHVDVNSAFLSWEAAYRISTGDTGADLRSIPSVVGGDREKRRGVVLAKSAECKKYGIVTGEPVAQALRKCPGLVVVPPRFSVYDSYSERLMALVDEYSDSIQQYSIDEVFLDFTHMRSYFGDEVKTADEIRRRCKDELGFSVCVGIGSNKLLAKMATELRKPDFTNTLYKHEIAEKLWPLPVGELFMVGRRSTEKLTQLGITTIGQLACADPKILAAQFKSYGRLIWEYANGMDDSPLESHTQPKSISSETTLANDVTDIADGRRVILRICERICADLRAQGLVADTVTVTVRTSSFKDFGHGHKLRTATDSTTEVYNAASELLTQMWRGEPLRLMGVRLSGLAVEDNRQLSLFDPADGNKKKAVDTAIDKIRHKYGFNAVKRASLVTPSKKPPPSAPPAP